MSLLLKLPDTPGYLPSFLLFISSVSVLNALAAFASPKGTQRVYAYSKDPVTPLTGRLFGTYTLLAGVIRAYAAYDLHNPTSYNLAFWTFIVAMAHFTSEGLVFKTAGLQTGAFPTYVVSIIGTIWMWLCWDDYVH